MPLQYNRGSDAELVWASSIRKFKGAPTFLPLKKGTAKNGRDRRTRGSSKDDESIVEEFIDEALRAGGPFLCPLPVTSRPLPDNMRHYKLIMDDDGFRTTVEGILAEHEIVASDYGVVLRKADNFPEDNPIVTFMVTAERKVVDDAWLHTCKKLRDLFVSNNFPDASVEIADKRAFLPRFMAPPFGSDKIFPVWDELLSLLLTSLDLTDIKTIACWRYGTSPLSEDNPPTILFTVDRNSVRKWKPLREKTVEIIDSYGIDDICIHVEKGNIIRSVGGKSDAGLPGSIWQKRQALVGVSIGNIMDSKCSATFGGYIELLNENGDWDRFGLTCYNAVLAPDDATSDNSKEAQLKWHSKGVEWHDSLAKKMLTLQQPSIGDLQDKQKAVQEQIDSIKDADFMEDRRKASLGELFPPFSGRHAGRERLLTIQENMASQIDTFVREKRAPLGHVACASGFRLKEHENGHVQHLDWALLMMEKSRTGNNRINAHGAPRFALLDDILVAPVKPEHGMPLYKLGRSTGWTTGTYSGLQSAVIETITEKDIKKTITTWESSVCSTNSQPFSDRGDSGSFIFNRNLAFVGLLFAGKVNGEAYITLAADLFDDIKAKTGAIDIRIPLD
ncbi:hypothetical protein ASPZODRAFT_142623 [Penicilliopsis zonata CBS 506.65]|uniref:Uncharacterized protein n=1 Tax=Penicilliopsis zonata CBS 506.65 TaxID=1073090 RepID=A0A1L9SFP0_9EURO|nr:hypothetical protein ASPZODRAFT_142623 [Penicilliopsis zonata CBS 506.65]OJJ45986.1 hypothetical protein ASPZODRAFT_142623 [Penicilliopsis zonata CBS 506.65]